MISSHGTRRRFAPALFCLLALISLAFCRSESPSLQVDNLNATDNSVLIDVLPPNITERIRIGGLYDLRSFPYWPGHLMNFTIHLLNNHSDGWHDDVLTDALLEGSMTNSACDPSDAIRRYVDFTKQRNPPNAIFGCRCSGASLQVASVCRSDNMAMVSPASTSVKLSNNEELPTFSRLAAPDDDRGQVGALIRLLRDFGWDRISIIHTDTQFTNDIALELSDAWKGQHRGEEDPFVGEIGYVGVIKLNISTDEIDKASAIRVLNAVPVENPNVNSRIIVLFAHHQHAFPILQLSNQLGFQPDTIWVGTSEWVGNVPQDGETSWMPPVPGYLGILPYRNKTSPIYVDYIERLQKFERENNLTITEDLTWDGDRIVDGLVALGKAFSAVPTDLRRDGWLITQKLRDVEFEGLSGPIAFTSQGDLKDPRYTVLTLRTNGTDWTPIGYVTPNYAKVASNAVCWAGMEEACTAATPDDEYPAEESFLPIWIWIVLASLVLFVFLLYYQRLTNRTVADKLQKIEAELSSLDVNENGVKQQKGRLYEEIARLLGQPPPEHWTNEQGLVVDIEPTKQEYWDVLQKLRETMTDGETCHLSKLSRIQNVGIWSYYVFRKNQLANKYGTDIEEIEEIDVWHGTSSLNPDIIYNDQQDGFMMQLSQHGQWGRGIYFSERSGYSDPYSFRPMTEHSNSLQQDRELLLVKLLLGESIFLDRKEGPWMEEACRNLLTPPDNPSHNGMKFDTVVGEIDEEAKTRIFVVYDNGRAYPEYLVRYYKGERDKTRTPYISIEAAQVDKSLKDTEAEQAKDIATGEMGSAEDDVRSVSSVVSVQAAWQFLNDSDQWENFLGGHQIQIEQAYQQDESGMVILEHFPWTYAIDFTVNLQTNLDHPERKTRRVRRIQLDGGG